MGKNIVNLTVNCDMTEAESKVTRLVELLKEASTLVDELASKGIKLIPECALKLLLQCGHSTSKSISYTAERA